MPRLLHHISVRYPGLLGMFKKSLLTCRAKLLHEKKWGF